MKRKLPLGIQEFAKIREQGYCYIDKTARIYELITGTAGPVFLSRPRRFGKSLLCSTLGAVFEGRRELFGSLNEQPPLAISTLDWEWKKYPVIRIDLNPGNYAAGIEHLNARLRNSLDDTARNTGLSLRGDVAAEQFYNLIRDMSAQGGQKTVVIIDEYDKPLLAAIDTPETHREIRNALKAFYGVLKSSDAHLQFVLLTGVTKFSQVSVFSDLNNLTDISLNPAYYDICGITQAELEAGFQSEIDEVVEDKQFRKTEYLALLKRYYNGYRFSEYADTVYNPFGLLNHFYNRGKFDAYWFSTGTPAFLIKLIEDQKIDILGLEKKVFTLAGLQKFNADNMDAVAVLYQSGYLTIVDYDEEFNEYTLDYPNEEVRSAFADALLEHYVSAADVNALAITVPAGTGKDHAGF
jgi:hypothetical protein